MSDFAASANLDWALIKFAILWLLGPLIVIVGSMSLLRHWRERRNR